MRFLKTTAVFAFVGAICLTAGAVSMRIKHAMVRHPVSGLMIVTPGQTDAGTILFNGWRISPAGRMTAVGDMPEGGAISPDGTTLAIANCGYTAHHLNIIDLKTESLVATLPASRLGHGIAWSPDGSQIYVAGGITNATWDVYRFKRAADGKWEQVDGIKLHCADAAKRRIAGLALSKDGQTLFVVNQYDGSVYAVNAASGEQLGVLTVGDHPYACKLAAADSKLYVANQGGSEIVAVNIANPAAMAIAAHIPVGSHPNDIVFAPDGRLFVSCANSDSVSVVDTVQGAAVESIRTSTSAHSPAGATPNSVAVSKDGKYLYAADADNNDVCVADISKRGHSRVLGFIPTGWYPTAVLAAQDNKRIIIATGKGTGTGPNKVTLPIPEDHAGNFQHHGNQLNGSLAFVDMPDAETLTRYTRQVVDNSPYRDNQLRAANNSANSVIPARIGEPCPIKHVLYIIRENRTYDQVFGDEPKGNGDARLCLFGRDVTPNGHQLAEQFTLLDNLYCSGEVSQDGHPWCVSASCTDFTQRSWVQSYSGHGDTEGSDSVEDPAAGFIWQACKKKGLSIRDYGEYADHPTLKSESCEEFIGKGKPGSAPPGRDMDKAAIFLDDFKALEAQNKAPNFMIMSLGEDHTSGTSPGAHTPKAMVGSNDQALGKIVEGLSHDKLWKEFAIFVIEDDAQNGPDHIDSHRTEGLVISPYVRRGIVDSTMYSTASMLRTIELIFGLKPLTRYDASANPMFASFSTESDLTPYTCLPPRTDLAAINGPRDFGAKKSAKMDFRGYDRADPDVLNDILWHSIKGAGVPMPAPVRSSFVGNGELGIRE
jgi:DNA-binding beta-propeller fold protein YncE